MHNVLSTFNKLASRAPKVIWAGLLVVLLAACGSLQDTSVTTTGKLDRFDSIAVIDIDPAANRGEIESTTNGKVVAFHPEAGFAIVGLHSNLSGLQAQTLDAEPNLDVFDPPEATAGGWTAWSGGWTAWSGGWTAWSGGWTAWSGGTETPSTFGENITIWDQINLPEAQALSSKLGTGVTVAVIDTGVDLDHPGLTCATLDRKGNCVSALAPSSMWADFVDGDNTPDEVPGAAYGHGTGVAGVILQMAPNVRILPLRALGPDGSGDVAAVVQAIDHALLEGANVINLSLGTDVPVDSLRAILDLAASQGVYVFASAGNAGVEGITYPASLSVVPCSNIQANSADCILARHLIGVSSVDASDVKTPWANYGVELEMVAPGENIHTLAPDGMRGVWSGTSFSTPMTAGAMALALSEPARNWSTNANPGTDLPDSSDSVRWENAYYLRFLLGKGRLDVMDFMNMVLE